MMNNEIMEILNEPLWVLRYNIGSQKCAKVTDLLLTGRDLLSAIEDAGSWDEIMNEPEQLEAVDYLLTLADALGIDWARCEDFTEVWNLVQDVISSEAE